MLREASIKEHIQNAHNYSKIKCLFNQSSRSNVWELGSISSAYLKVKSTGAHSVPCPCFRKL